MSEKLTHKIAEFLKTNCPAFRFTPSGEPYGRAGSVWHGCLCGITDEHCEYTWHETDTCHQGIWMMNFLTKAQVETELKRQHALEEMRNVPSGVFRKK